ncbi:MAG: extracellular solute-binding protein [Nocardioidaceae bacterium]
MIRRREFLKTMGTAGLAVAGSGALLSACGGGGSSNQSGGGGGGDFSGQTLTVLTETGPTIASAVKASIDPFKKATGAQVKLITAPFGQLYTKIMSDFVTGGGGYDVVICASSWLGDFHPFITDLTDRVKNDSSLDWDEVTYKKTGQWAGRQIGMPVDGDVMLAYYRRDVIEDKGLGRKFKKEFGKPLAPPESWDDFMNIARFFGDGEHGVHGVVEAYKHGGQAFWYYMANCVAYCTAPDEKGGLFFNPENLEPLVNDPGHIKGMENYAEAVKYGPPGMINFDSNEVRQRFANGEAVLAIDWLDTPIIGELQKGSKVKGKIGSQHLPGTNKVWDYKKEQWVTSSKLSIPAWLAYGGWCGVVPQKADSVDLSYKYLSFMASPDFSLKMVTTPNSGMNPYRTSHFEDLDAWKKAGYPQPDLNQYLDAAKKAETNPQAVQDLRLPGASIFQDSTEVAAQQAVSGQSSAKDALDGLVKKWNQVNGKKGKDKQLKEYRASLNLSTSG